MDARLSEAVALFVADARASGVDTCLPRFEYGLPLEHITSNYDEGALDEHWSGLVRYVADELQDWVIHRLWRDVQRPTNWPVCPRHPTTHPLKPVERDDAAVWICPAEDVVIAPVGELIP